MESSSEKDWSKASNVVLKEFIDPVVRETYFEKVTATAEAKMFAQEFNKYKPPKPVDFLAGYVLEFHERSEKPCYHMEAFLEGEYEKHR